MPRLPGILRSVRVRLLVIALLPMLVLLPVMLGGAMWRWSAKIDNLLVTKVTGDLTIADQYLARLIEMSGERVDAIARSVDLREAIGAGRQAVYLEGERQRLGLDFLRIAAPRPRERAWPVIAAALDGQRQSAIDIFDADQLEALATGLAERAEIALVTTRAAVPTDRTDETRGMIIHSAAPLVLPDGTRVALVGGRLLNRNLDFIDTINALVYRDRSLPAGSQGTATLFLDDVRVSTNVRLFEAVRALGTRVSAEVRAQVLDEGRIWLDRAFVVNEWYISAYEPILDSFGRRVGMLYVGFLETPFREAKRTSILALGAAFVLIALVSVPVFLRWARHIFRPLEGMTRTIAQVEAGDLAARNHPPEAGGEIAQLARHFDSLLDRLQARDRELRSWAESLETRVEERTRDLRAANLRLERTTERLIMSEKLAAVGEITASVAHEINNPVAVIQGNLDLARSTLGAEADKVAEEFALIDDQVYRIGVIVSKLLQFARPEDYSGSADLIAPAEVVKDCLVLTRHQVQAAGIVCEVRAEGTGTVAVSRTELQQVIVNLILNAVHAMPDGGSLRVVANDCKDGVEVTVEDSGTGIAPEVLPRIFDPFFTTKQAQGTGLGLSISQQIVSRAGGRITAASIPGQGSRFRVFLPSAQKT
ncbi:two-component sensor histidine kinase [Rhodovulum sulfidophilum]|uniref:histidine kinase n=1 Tax=Rhodovulum visakhapatnamense TaxID=364297 RepID=A0ABS1RB46_9RHOB|nr:cache domain-containing protein [Rhodovulum visakhapatnamense]MBL3570382.1 cache domain-containing protein [Rhodovulum visakhapatnamense]MBL3576838.1 cache domain-containing protein [Rhodovulum visakhapatnamense]OLS43940.1 two-component sensor histidine kinase [Rhodovulum sulfidophilum]